MHCLQNATDFVPATIVFFMGLIPDRFIRYVAYKSNGPRSYFLVGVKYTCHAIA